MSAALGNDILYVRSDDPAGGTAFAAFEAFSVPGLMECNPLLIISMGDRIVPPSVFRNLCEIHRAGAHEAGLTFLTALYEPPKNHGKGRVLRDQSGRVVRIAEERDILAEPDAAARQALLDVTEGNCPLYVVRAAILRRYLENLRVPSSSPSVSLRFGDLHGPVIALPCAQGVAQQFLNFLPLPQGQ